MVADAIAWLRTLGLYQDNRNKDLQPAMDDVIKNIIEEVHSTDVVPGTPAYNMVKLYPQKEVKLKYTVEQTIVVPRKLTSLIIVEFHNAEGHQGISCTVNMMRHYFWWVGMCRDVHQHVNSCKLCIQFLPNRMHLEIPPVPFTGCTMDCIRPLPATLKGSKHALTFICFLTP